jgi:YVTN family beta-propeller protein
VIHSVTRHTVPLALGSFLVTVAAAPAPARAQDALVNWETPHVSPLALTPDGARLLAVNTPDNRLEVFDLASGVPVPLLAIPVGLDPVSVRARTSTEAWVVNHVSDSVSIVDLAAGNVVATLDTDDEPCDVVFAGTRSTRRSSC